MHDLHLALLERAGGRAGLAGRARGDLTAPAPRGGTRCHRSRPFATLAPMSGDHPQILIVDNDDRIVELVSWFLKKRGYGVRSARTFAGARAAIAALRPDLMLSDVDLGVEDATVELPRLAAAGALPPTLVVSGYLDARVEAELARLPAVLDTLSKPFDFSVLEARITECLARARHAVPGGDGHGGGGADEAIAEDGEGWIEIRPLGPAGDAARARAAAERR